MIEFFIDERKTVDYRFIEDKTKAWEKVKNTGADKFGKTLPFDDALISIKDKKDGKITRETFIARHFTVGSDKHEHLLCHAHYIGKYQTKFLLRLPLADEEDLFFAPIPFVDWAKYPTPLVTKASLVGIRTEDDMMPDEAFKIFYSIMANTIAEIYIVWSSCLNNQTYNNRRYRQIRIIERGEDKKDYRPIQLRKGIKAIIRDDEPIDTVATRQYTRHLDAWFCRGHERHYKSGKIVWVKPHVRGKGTVKDTEYNVG